jgi:hypothetical protein
MSARHLLLLLVAGCGAPRYSAVRILDPVTRADSVIMVGSLELRLRIGEEWIELLAENRGGTDIGVDFGQIQFIAPSGVRHDLITAGRIGAELSQQVGGGSSGGAHAFSPVPLHRFRIAPHTAPPELGVSGPAVRTLRPGQRVEEILYPAEHVSIEEYRFSAAPLFCRTPGAIDGRIFEVVVPVLQPGGWRTIPISAERIDQRKVGSRN